jgi:hypothetical protein
VRDLAAASEDVVLVRLIDAAVSARARPPLANGVDNVHEPCLRSIMYAGNIVAGIVGSAQLYLNREGR